MIKKLVFIIGLLILNDYCIHSQSELVKAEISLKELLQKVRNKGLSTEELFENNKSFKDKLIETMTLKGAIEYPFDSLKTLGKLISPDKEFRLFNWNIEMKYGTQVFYCIILTKNGEIIELSDRHKQNENCEDKTLDNKNWYGALYYEIIPINKGNYTLLGWNGKTNITTQKIIEVMSFSGKSKVKFGAPIFLFFDSEGKRKEVKKRVIFEYSDDAYMSLKFHQEKKEKIIIYDHLSPNTPNMEGHYQFYYPDFSYDAFKLENGKWLHQSDIYTENKKSEKDKLYNDPKKNKSNQNTEK